MADNRMLMTVGDMVRLNAASMPHKLALVAGKERLTYADVNRRVNRLAHALGRAGVGNGDRVAALGYNTPDYYCLYFATAKIGALLLPLNFWYRAEEHRHVLTDGTPALILHQPDFGGVLTEALDGQDTPMIEMPAPGGKPGAAWQKFLADLPDDEPEAEIGPETPHMVLYTSGTTGRPKGAVLSQQRTVLDAFSMSTALGVRENDVFANYFPPFHVGNWDHQKLFVLAGATIVLVPQFDPGVILDLVESERISVVLTVPTMLNLLMKHKNFDACDTSSIRLLYYGAYDPSGILDRAAEVFGAREGRIEMAHCYGLTEAGTFATLCRPHEVFENWGSIGRPVPGVELVLVDDEDRPVAQGEHGEICLRGPRMSEYWNNPEATSETIRDGWLHTGDVGVMNERGFIWIVDRKKDMIRSGGHNVYSKEVEDCLVQHGAVDDCAVIGLDDPDYEEMVVAAVVLKPGEVASDALVADIQSFVRTRKAGYNVPKCIRFVDELPKNAVGKIQKHILRECFSQAETSDTD